MHANRTDLRGEAQAQADLVLEKSTSTKSALMAGMGQSPTSAGRVTVLKCQSRSGLSTVILVALG
jgi:hypothetical protein